MRKTLGCLLFLLGAVGVSAQSTDSSIFSQLPRPGGSLPREKVEKPIGKG